MTQFSEPAPIADPITDAQFSAAWVVLQNRFRVQFDEQTILTYRSILVAELDAAQFATACRASFRFDNFFPSPQRLVDLGRGRHDFTAAARDAWDQMLDRVQAGRTATEVDTPERKILNRLTLGESLDKIPHARLYWLRKEFVERYVDFLEREGMAASPSPLALAAGARRQALTNADENARPLQFDAAPLVERVGRKGGQS